MTIKTTIVAAGTAIAIAAASRSPVAAAPFSAAVPTTAAAGTGGVETVGHKHHHYHGGAAAAVGLSAFALGVAIAADQNRRYRECYVERVKVWSPRYNAYVVRKEKVCY